MDGLSVVQQSLDLARESGAAWVFAGDMKQPKTSWPQSALTGLHEIFRKYQDVEKVMVAGNHDAEGEGGCGLAPFSDVACVVDRTQAVCIRGGAVLVCCPWNGDTAEAARLLALPLASGQRVLVAHGFLSGCLLGPEDVRIAKGTPVAAYGGFDLAVFGDVHKSQWRVPADPAKGRPAAWVAFPDGKTTIPSGSVLYCGSPYQQNWGERNDPPKGAVVVDLDAWTARLQPLAAPRYVHLELDEAGVERFLAEKEDRQVFLRVVYSGRPCAALDALHAAGDEFRSFQLITRRDEPRLVKRAPVHAGMTTRELLSGYVEARPPAGVDRARAVEAGVRLVAEGAL